MKINSRKGQAHEAIRKFVTTDGSRVPELAKFEPNTDVGIDHFCRLMLPARILSRLTLPSMPRKVRVQKDRLLEDLTSTEEVEVLCDVSFDSKMPPVDIPLAQRRPKWWVKRTLWALEKTGHIRNEKGAYSITPLGKKWLGKVKAWDKKRVRW